MPNVTGPSFSLPAKSFPAQTSGVPAGVLGELGMSEFMARYGTLVKAGVVQTALAIVTAPVIWSTAAGAGGPLIWNKPNSGVDAYILAVTFSNPTTASGESGALGVATSIGQTVAPTTATAIDASGNAYAGGAATKMGAVDRIATVANAATVFVPLSGVSTGATSVFGVNDNFVELAGMIVVSPGSCGFVAATATLTTAVIQIGLIWAELPV